MFYEIRNMHGRFGYQKHISICKMMVQNLASGQKFYLKVVSVDTAGVGPDSEIAEAIAA